MDDETLEEAAQLAVLRSSCWRAKLAGATEAFWVYAHQVSKVAEAGEYLSQGALMVRGKKNFISIHRLEVGIGIHLRRALCSCLVAAARSCRGARSCRAWFCMPHARAAVFFHRILVCALLSAGLLFRCAGGDADQGEAARQQGRPGLAAEDTQDRDEDWQEDGGEEGEGESAHHDPALALAPAPPVQHSSAQHRETRGRFSSALGHAAPTRRVACPPGSSNASNPSQASAAAAGPHLHRLDHLLAEEVSELGLHGGRQAASATEPSVSSSSTCQLADPHLVVEGLSEVAARVRRKLARLMPLCQGCGHAL